MKVASLAQQYTDGRHQDRKEQLHYEQHQLLAGIVWIGHNDWWHGDKNCEEANKRNKNLYAVSCNFGKSVRPNEELFSLAVTAREMQKSKPPRR